MTKQQKIADFDPNQPGVADSSIFGLPFTAEESELIIIPVPWEVTVSYGAGASSGPESILSASFQIDLHHQLYPELWKLGMFILDAPSHWIQNSAKYKEKAAIIIAKQEKGERIADYPELQQSLDEINEACELLNNEVKELVLHWMRKGKKVALLGGDHSTPLGYYQALAELNEEFGILHLDAHMDFRKAYEGFTYSHASIMNNALELPQVAKIVQVGIRDFCEQEVESVKAAGDRVKVYTDLVLKEAGFEGKTWKEQCAEIIDALPKKVAVSFDIDALYQWYCPNTGTPVPGGLSFEQASYLLALLADSDREIIGFDLVEVSPGEDEWDGNVGARLLFNLCGAFAKSQQLPTGAPIQF